MSLKSVIKRKLLQNPDGLAPTPKIRHKSGFTRKNSVKIRKAILDSITSYPKDYREIALDVGSDPRTIKKHLATLENIGVVKLANFRIADFEKQLWIKVSK